MPLFRTFIFILILSIPTLSFAAGVVPCGGTGQETCQACHVFQLGQNLLAWFIGIMASIIALVFAWGGLKMVMSGGGEGVSEAKGMMTNSVIGFIILLSSYLIVDTFLKTFVDGAMLGTWNKITCVKLPVYTTDTTSSSNTSSSGSSSSGTATGNTTEGTISQADAAKKLADAGVSVSSSGNCSDRTNPTCTSLDGMRNDTLDQVLNIKNACPTCAVIVTGGTEPHSTTGTMTHGNGYKVDIDDLSSIDSFLESTLTRSGDRSGSDGGPRYLDSCGNEYVKESSHWDITISNGSCKF